MDADGSPVSVSWNGDSRRNIIVWMDHRAVKQAEKINSRNSPVLQYCGGAVSPEMQPPKVSEQLFYPSKTSCILLRVFEYKFKTHGMAREYKGIRKQ